jgi:hypothetical protein
MTGPHCLDGGSLWLQLQGNALGISSVGRATRLDAVDVHTRRGAVNAVIYGFSQWFFLSQSNTTVSEVYQTHHGVTSKEDSGGPVLLQGQPGQIIGHVVGGGPATSFIQDAGHQLTALRNIPGFQTINI